MTGDAFHYLNETGQPVGPFSLAHLRAMAAAGILGRDIPVRGSTEEDWRPLHEVGDSPPSSPPPRSIPPPPPRPTMTAETSSSPTPTGAFPDWFPVAALIAGIAALLTSCVPILSWLFAGSALAFGILSKTQDTPLRRSLSLAGMMCGGVSLLLSSGVLLFGNTEASAIEQVLHEGGRLASLAQKKHPDDAPAQARLIAAGLQRIDTSDCPPEFRVAYQRHVQAWRQAIPYIEANTPLTAFLEGIVGGSTGDISVIGGANHQAELACREIDRTYDELTILAVAHGAKIPSS